MASPLGQALPCDFPRVEALLQLPHGVLQRRLQRAIAVHGLERLDVGEQVHYRDRQLAGPVGLLVVARFDLLMRKLSNRVMTAPITKPNNARRQSMKMAMAE